MKVTLWYHSLKSEQENNSVFILAWMINCLINLVGSFWLDVLNKPLAYNFIHLKIGRTVHRLVSGSMCFIPFSSSRVSHASGTHMAWYRVSSYRDVLLCQQSSTFGSIAGSHSKPEKTGNCVSRHRIVCEPQKHVLLNPNYTQCSLSWMLKIPMVTLTPLSVRASMTEWKLK